MHRLKLAGERPEYAIAGVGILFRGHRTRAFDLFELLECLDQRRFGHGGLNSASDHEHRRPDAPVNHGVVAVAIPFVLPQVAVKSGHKLAAENEI